MDNKNFMVGDILHRTAYADEQMESFPVVYRLVRILPGAMRRIDVDVHDKDAGWFPDNFTLIQRHDR
jgi:hypothetical protein